MKKLFSLLLILLLATQADIYAKKVKQLTPTITWELRGDTLVISGTGDMPDIEAKKAPWFNKRKKITSIIIGEGITRIGNENFSAHDSRRKYKVYSNLTSISLPSTLKEIGKSAFYRCRVDSLTLPEGIKKIEEHAFNNGYQKNINFPSSLTEIGRWAFFNNSLSHIIIPGSVKHIGKEAFGSNPGHYIELKEGVIEIGESAFKGCYMKDLSLPKTLKVIGSSAFNCYSSDPNLTELILPTGLERIGAYAFYGHRNLKSISFPSTVKSIGKYAFCIHADTYDDKNYYNDNFKGTILNPPEWLKTVEDYEFIGISRNSCYEHSSQYYYYKGEEYYDAKDYKTALTYFLKGTKAFEYDSLHRFKGKCYYYAGLCYRSLNDSYKELEMMINADILGEVSSEYVARVRAKIEREKISTLLNSGEYDSAFKKYSEVYKTSKSLSDLIAVPEYFEKKKDYSNAVKYYKKAYEIKSDSSLANHIADIYFKQNDYTNAIEWYSIKAQQGDKETQYKLGQVYEKANNKNLAVFWYRKAAEQKHLKAEEALAHYGVYITPQQNTSKAQASNSSSSSSSTTKNSRANRPLPFSLAYCLDGKTQNISTREIMHQDPAVGYMTFYKNKIQVDNEEYKYKETKDGIRIFQGPTLRAHGGICIPLLFVNPDYNIINLFLSVKNSAGKDVGTLRAIVYLMEVDEFNELWNQNSGINTNLFVTNSDISHTEDVSSYSSSGGSKSYYSSNYGWKDCYFCGGDGNCPTCGGDGIMDGGFGSGSTQCPNCSSTASRKGVCSVCQGKGKVYGVKY